MRPELVAVIAELTRAEPVRWKPAAGGYTNAERWLVELEDGRTLFAKAAVDDNTSAWLRRELIAYGVGRQPFLARFLGWDDYVRPVLLLEDLSGGHWPPPWKKGQVERLIAALDEIHSTRAPDDLEPMEKHREMYSGWQRVAEDPEPFLSLRLRDRAWLDAHLDTLVAAEAAMDLSGDSLVHQDVRSDNVCFFGDRVLLVDWNWALRGNGVLDLAFFAPSLHLEGGPEPATLLPDEPEAAAVVSGFFAASAGLPPGTPGPSPAVRALQRAQLESALPWAEAVTL